MAIGPNRFYTCYKEIVLVLGYSTIVYCYINSVICDVIYILIIFLNRFRTMYSCTYIYLDFVECVVLMQRPLLLLGPLHNTINITLFFKLLF